MTISSWLVSSQRRVYPKTLAPRESSKMRVEIARNERFSFQVAIRNDGASVQKVEAVAVADARWEARVRRVGYVPVRNLNTNLPPGNLDVEGRAQIPGYVPDPLFEEHSILLPPGETHSFWVSVKATEALTAGEHSLMLVLQSEGESVASHDVSVLVHALSLERPRFSMTHWFYIDALMDWYKTDGFDDALWKLLPAYFRNMTEHGLNTLYTALFTPPLDGVKRPSQLLHVTEVEPGEYRFDWSVVARFVAVAQECGFSKFEWSHLFTQWGAKNAIRVYRGHGEDESLLWDAETEAISPVYRNFLEQFLPEFHRFLKEHELMECSFYHISDEPEGEVSLESYKRAKGMISELAPWMYPVIDALSEISFARAGVVDLPAVLTSSAMEFVKEGIESWCYYCCIPRNRYINRLLDTPLSKIAMHGILFYRWPFKGFLHWGYNYWHRSQSRKLADPFTEQDGMKWPTWAYGDPFVVYPGEEGPIDSIRWEVFSESLQDYALLQTLKIDRSHPLLKEVRSFEKFPKTESWRHAFRKKVFELHCAQP